MESITELNDKVAKLIHMRAQVTRGRVPGEWRSLMEGSGDRFSAWGVAVADGCSSLVL